MKKITFLLLLASFVTNTAFTQKHELLFNLERGKTYKFRQNTEQKITQSIMGNEQILSNRILSVYSMTMTEKTGGHALVEFSIEELIMTTGIQGQEKTMSSKDPEEGDIGSQIFANMIGNKMILEILPTGKIKRINGSDRFFESAIEKLNITAEQKEQMKKAMEGTMGGEAFANSIEMITFIYPDKKVSVGESWNNQHLVSSVINATYKNNFTLEQLTGAEVHISATSDITTSSELTQTNGFPTRYKLSGTQTALYISDVSSGWISSGDVKSTIEGNVVFEDTPAIPGGMEMPMKIESITTYTLF